MKKQKNTAILVVSFGTSHADTRKRTIEAIELEAAAAFPDCSLFHAWTSSRILAKLKKEGCPVFTLEEALEQILSAHIPHVVVQPTHVLNGIENDYMKACVLAYRHKFQSISFGAPLLDTEEDCRAVIQAVAEEFSSLKKSCALVLMGHGTAHKANNVYTQLQNLCHTSGHANFFIGTVEAAPSLCDVIDALKQTDYREIVLTPFMVVAGDHAKNDMAGDGPDSWKSRLETEGFTVTPILKGLGEYASIRRIFLEHAKKALTDSKASDCASI